VLLYFFALFADQLKANPSRVYSLSVWRKHHREVKFEEQKVKLVDWLIPLIVDEKRPQIVNDDKEESQENQIKNILEFSFLLFKGDYRVHIQSCETTNNTFEDVSSDFDCDRSTEVVSEAVHVDETSQIFDEESWCFGPHAEDHSVKKLRPLLEVILHCHDLSLII
jgi:hypothetical protein